MSNNKPCEVENCSGHYVSYTLSYCNIRKVKTDKYNISVEEYNSLSDLNKKGYHKVIESKCDVCNDSLDDRILAFIKETFNG